MTLFGFTQLDFAGALPVADGRYVVREDGEERVLAIQTIGAPPPPRRRRRRPREAELGATPETVPLTRVTAIRAFSPFDTKEGAARWLEGASADEDSVDSLLAEGVEIVNRALHAHAVASGDPHGQVLIPERAVAARIGYGSGKQVADGDFTDAREIDARGSAASRRQQRAEELRPQERIAAVLGEREQLDACETLLLRARADLDANRTREATLQLRIGLEALLIELQGALADPGHEEDMAALSGARHEVGELANTALRGDLSAEQIQRAEELLYICERVLRRRRVLRG